MKSGKVDHGPRILATLKQHGGSMSPGRLASALGFKSSTALAYHFPPLQRTKAIVVVGQSASRRVRLPSAHAAKEAP